jgi:hypothetical protein
VELLGVIRALAMRVTGGFDAHTVHQGLVMNCPDCKREVQYGGTLTKDCDGCLRIAMQLRAVVKERGKKIGPLAPWALERCRTLGIELDERDWQNRKDIRVLS